MTVAYLQKNFAPVVNSISVDGNDATKKNGGGGKAAAKAGKAAAMVAMGMPAKASPKVSDGGVKATPKSHKTNLKIKWKASDENKDELKFEVYFKGVEEKRWKLIKDDLTAEKLDWDTEAVPDGEYHVKVVATDAPANPEPDALRGERVSEYFTVDNTPPTVSTLKVMRTRDGGGYQITGTVSDKLGPVRSAHYSIDAGEWISVFPADGIFDARSEKMEFAIGQLEQGEHTVVLKAIDYFGNVGSGKITYEAK